MSAQVAETIRSTFHLPLEDLGMQQFRNMFRSVHVFQCRFLGNAAC